MLNQGGETVTKNMVVMTDISHVRGSDSDVTPMRSSRGGAPSCAECSETDADRRRQQVLAMLNTADGQRMVRQMFVVRDELKHELAGLAQRLRRIDQRIETMLHAESA